MYKLHPAHLDAEGRLKLPHTLQFLLWWLLRYPLIWVGSLMAGQRGGAFLNNVMPSFDRAWPWMLPALPAIFCLWLAGLRNIEASERFWWAWRQQGWLLVLTVVADLAMVIGAIIQAHGQYSFWLALELAIDGWALVYLLSSNYLPALWRDRGHN
ncbi:DUF2919 family protein [Gallaecimonas sp. GXIMD1310]|uniref:DUF2919 family protein n=1 Tax=Gallaecimonas sp. GXIMD1310 TaxID=3131926 RepID=UPI00324C976F